jgi:hypothetical protein
VRHRAGHGYQVDAQQLKRVVCGQGELHRAGAPPARAGAMRVRCPAERSAAAVALPCFPPNTGLAVSACHHPEGFLSREHPSNTHEAICAALNGQRGSSIFSGCPINAQPDGTGGRAPARGAKTLVPPAGYGLSSQVVGRLACRELRDGGIGQAGAHIMGHARNCNCLKCPQPQPLATATGRKTYVTRRLPFAPLSLV